MQAYVIKRVLLLIPTLLLATMVVFVILRIVPGDPALAILLAEAQEGDVKFLQEDLDELRKKLGHRQTYSYPVRYLVLEHAPTGLWVIVLGLKTNHGPSVQEVSYHLGADGPCGPSR